MFNLRGSETTGGSKEAPMYMRTDAAEFRAKRRVVPFVSDYLPDELEYTLDQRLSFYTKLKELGVAGVRTEFRLGKLMRDDGSFDLNIEKSYRESLKAMKEAGLSLSALVLFSPAEWMVDLAQHDETAFLLVYQSFIEKAQMICDQAGLQPTFVQVMNEVNNSFFKNFEQSTIVKMIDVTHQAYSLRTDKPKIMTTIITNTAFADRSKWRKDVETLVKRAGDALEAVGFDYYFAYDHPLEPLMPQSVFDLYKDKKEVFEWLLEQKSTGFLRDKEVLIAEMGMPVFQKSDFPVYNDWFAQIGYDLYYRAIDHVMLQWERQGGKAEDFISHVGLFCGGDHAAVQTYAPGKIDFLPWTLLHFNKETKDWDLTDAAKRLPYLNSTRLNPQGS